MVGQSLAQPMDQQAKLLADLSESCQWCGPGRGSEEWRQCAAGRHCTVSAVIPMTCCSVVESAVVVATSSSSSSGSVDHGSSALSRLMSNSHGGLQLTKMATDMSCAAPTTLYPSTIAYATSKHLLSCHLGHSTTRLQLPLALCASLIMRSDQLHLLLTTKLPFVPADCSFNWLQ